MKHVPPSIRETAFNCPHCGALAKQFWYSARVDELKESKPVPVVLYENWSQEFDWKSISPEAKKSFESWGNRMALGFPFLEAGEKGPYDFQNLRNVWISRCFNCNEIAIWICDKLIYPSRGKAPLANPDLSSDIRRDYDEASAILDLSPRGAAALLRLAIQKLCKELGQTGKNINDDIKALVAAGLDSRVQKALDAVRVIGNNAVHPGSIDLKDDRATAEALFKLLNLIAEKMISEPKHVDEVYASLPQSARDQIEKRDGKKQD